jgi:hypothetical protein
MKALMFIQKNDGVIYYKCDTFWTESSKVNHAKIYGDNDQSEIDKWLTPYGYNIEIYLKDNPNELDNYVKKYDGCKMGYRTINDNLLQNAWRLKDDVEEKDLGNVIYTHEIKMNGLLRPDIFDIRKQNIREQKIKQILN